MTYMLSSIIILNCEYFTMHISVTGRRVYTLMLVRGAQHPSVTSAILLPADNKKRDTLLPAEISLFVCTHK